MTITVGRCLRRKSMLVWVREYISKNFATCKSLCTLQELYTAFKVKQPHVNIRFPNVCAWRPKSCVLAGSKMTYSDCVCRANKNVVFLVDAIDWKLICKDLINLPFSSLKYFHENFFAITFIWPSFTIFFNWNITSSPYLKILWISMIKLLFLFFLSDRIVQYCFL